MVSRPVNALRPPIRSCSRPNLARPTPATTIRERHDQSYPGVLDPAPLACRHVQSGGRSVGRLVLEPAADRRRARHHEQAGEVNTTAPALSPTEIEKQVTLRIETALAGIPGIESTRSLSRNGFSQVTAIFAERTDIYFARQQISERLIELRAGLPPGCLAATGTYLHRPRRNLYVGGRLCVRCG